MIRIQPEEPSAPWLSERLLVPHRPSDLGPLLEGLRQERLLSGSQHIDLARKDDPTKVPEALRMDAKEYYRQMFESLAQAVNTRKRRVSVPRGAFYASVEVAHIELNKFRQAADTLLGYLRTAEQMDGISGVEVYQTLCVAVPRRRTGEVLSAALHFLGRDVEPGPASGVSGVGQHRQPRGCRRRLPDSASPHDVSHGALHQDDFHAVGAHTRQPWAARRGQSLLTVHAHEKHFNSWSVFFVELLTTQPKKDTLNIQL